MPNCISCLNHSKCTACKAAYVLEPNSGTSIDKCLLCSDLIFNCHTCSIQGNNTTCTRCISSLMRLVFHSATNKLSCLKCSDFMSDCNICKETHVCLQCYTAKNIKHGCTKVKGCIKVDPLLPIT